MNMNDSYLPEAS